MEILEDFLTIFFHGPILFKVPSSHLCEELCLRASVLVCPMFILPTCLSIYQGAQCITDRILPLGDLFRPQISFLRLQISVLRHQFSILRPEIISRKALN